MKVFAVLLFLASAAQAFDDSESARLARKARKAQSSGDTAEAYLLYTQASTLDPGNKSYRAKANQLSAKAAALAKKDYVPSSGSEPTPDPSEVFDSPTDFSFKPPPELHPLRDRFDINLDGDYKTLFTQIATLFHLDCVFDSDYEPGRRMHFGLAQADYRDALHALSAATGSFVVPVSDKIFLVAKDLPQKRTDLEQAMSITIQIPQYISTQELIEIAQAVRQATGVEKLAWDNKTGSVIMRDRISRVMPAEELFYNLFSYRPQVMIDLQLIELNRSDMLNYGVNLPSYFPITFTGNNNTTTTSTSTNSFPYGSLSYILTALANPTGTSMAQAMIHGFFPTSLSVWSISIGAATSLINFSNSIGKTVLTQNLRSVDAQPATFHYGQRYPILTGSFTGNTTVGTQYVPTPSFTFEDLGVTLKVTPHIHGMESVTLEVESEFKLLTGATNNGNPIIANRKLKSSVSLDENEWAIVAGLEQDSDSRNLAGTAGLSSVPVLSQIFSQHMKDKEKTEVLILMRLHLLNLPGDQNVPRDVRVGTETRPYTPL